MAETAVVMAGLLRQVLVALLLRLLAAGVVVLRLTASRLALVVLVATASAA
jgi:hypothetical protein